MYFLNPIPLMAVCVGIAKRQSIAWVNLVMVFVARDANMRKLPNNVTGYFAAKIPSVPVCSFA